MAAGAALAIARKALLASKTVDAFASVIRNAALNAWRTGRHPLE